MSERDLEASFAASQVRSRAFRRQSKRPAGFNCFFLDTVWTLDLASGACKCVVRPAMKESLGLRVWGLGKKRILNPMPLLALSRGSLVLNGASSTQSVATSALRQVFFPAQRSALSHFWKLPGASDALVHLSHSDILLLDLNSLRNPLHRLGCF